jgi:hypothetical protein
MVNDYGVFYMIQSLPFGGTKLSGFGKFNGPEGLRAFCRQKAFLTDRFQVAASVPSFIRYPTTPKAHLIMEQAVEFIFNNSWWNSLKAGVQMVKLLLSK